MASTGSTEGYNTDNYSKQGSTELGVGGLLKMFANSAWRWGGSTYADGSTLPAGGLSVVGGSTNKTYTLASSRPGDIAAIVCVSASSSGIQKIDCQVTMDNSTRTMLNFNGPGGVLIYAQSTTAYTVLASHPTGVAGSSDIVAST